MQQGRCSIVVSIPACHAGDPGSIPGNGDFFYLFWKPFYLLAEYLGHRSHFFFPRPVVCLMWSKLVELITIEVKVFLKNEIEMEVWQVKNISEEKVKDYLAPVED